MERVTIARSAWLVAAWSRRRWQRSGQSCISPSMAFSCGPYVCNYMARHSDARGRLGRAEPAVCCRKMLCQRCADQCLVIATHRLIVSGGIDRFLAVMMLGDFDAGLQAAIGWNAIVQAVPALDHEHRHAPERKELRV